MKSCKKQKAVKHSGAEAIKIKKYVYNDQPQFLKKVVGDRSTRDSLSNTEAPRDGTDEAHPETTKTSTEGSKAGASTLKPPPQQPRSRRRRNPDPVELKLLKVLEEGNTPNRHLSFFQGIIPSLQTLDEDAIVQFQIGVLQLISNVKRQKHTSTIVSQPSTVSRAQFPSPYQHQIPSAYQPQPVMIHIPQNLPGISSTPSPTASQYYSQYGQSQQLSGISSPFSPSESLSSVNTESSDITDDIDFTSL
jgi:hypothetical protein